MYQGRNVVIPAILIALLLCPACVTLRGPEDVRRDISSATGVRFEREMGLTIKRSGMWLARWGLRVSGEDDISLRGIKRVEVGIYLPKKRHEGAAPGRLDMSQFEGWSPIVRVHEEDEEALVMVRVRKGEIRGMLVVVSEPDELVLVRMKGRLDRILEEAMSEAFDQADRPDLYEKSREERGLEPALAI
jgi:hypothetical protein